MAACGIDEPKASCHLRALQSRGLLVAERVGRRVFYHLQTDPLVAGADEMLAALRASIRRHDPISSRMHCLTAFTHPRRIQVVRGLDASPMRATELVIRCGISAPALHRHLAKLRRRGLVEAEGESVWHLTRPEQGFARDLVDLVLAK
jgi:DNA-binding transcriptional ArsR family regulator